MNLSLRRLAVICALTLISSLMSPAQALGPALCTKVLTAPQNGLNALNNLQGNLAAVAALNGKSESVLRNLLETDSSFWLDECGLGFYVEETAKNLTTTVSVSAAPYAYDQTFKLHSKPGSSKTIYLDFNGHSFSGTAWNSYFRVSSPYFASGYSQDADFANFNSAEMDVIQSVWQRVSEDYAPFDVDVTTEEPAAGVLERATASDNIYGTRAVVTGDSGMQTRCGCGGVAYVGVFDNTGTAWSNYQPAWVFTRGVGTGAKNITEALSHEVGHNLGLSHDGRTVPQEGYFQGAAGWAPIMGVGYYQGLTQWSKGEYPNANNIEDDYVVMSNNGLTFRSDEDLSNSASARPLTSSVSGIIAGPTDSDWYSFTASATGNVSISANVAPVSPNLDIRLDLYTSSNLSAPVASADPSMTMGSGNDSISGLSASLTYSVLAGTTYFLKVDGVGFGLLSSNGYSDYGSLGSYTITSSGIESTYVISSATFSPTTSSVIEGYSSGATSTLTLMRSGNSGSDPVATLSVSGGTWSIANATNLSVSGAPTNENPTTLTLTNPSVNSSGTLALTLNGATAGAYTATLSVGAQTLATYTVTVSTSVPGQVQGLICTKNNGKTGKCSWTALIPAPSRYEYRYRVSPTGSWTGWTSNSLSTNVTIGGLRSGVVYDVEVRAVNGAGTAGISATTQLRM